MADLPLAMQVKLLRAIQEKKVRKVGSTQEEPVDVRLISATHKKLTALVESGEFRQDLFYRLHVIELAMPNLREMREDIPLIANAILAKLSRGTPARLDADALVALEHYSFPGNVRELENILERGLSLAADPGRASAPPTCISHPRATRARRPSRAVTSGRCRTISIASSAPPSPKRWRRPATTAPPRRAARHHLPGRCVTGWNGWGSSDPFPVSL
ncbi:MAG: sigma 54-interacting transcriptional regulator [Betaproteobacteria bacterium]|nr:sigma 54-interacting transcriptional regulator [Betaproteobacteria bacterium]